MGSQKITTKLFSFKTFRSPDKIDLLSTNVFFVQHPDVTKSIFSKCADLSGNEGSEARASEFFSSLKPVNGYKSIRGMHPEMYDFSCRLMLQKRNDSTKKQFNTELPTPLSDEAVLRIWDELFVQTATQKSPSARQACIQILIAQHYLRNNKYIELSDIAKVVVVVPSSVIDCIKSYYYSKCGGKLFGVHNLGVQEYRRVEQTLCCYVPGEVSHIENIMAREYKEKSTRNLLRTEYVSEFTSETEIESLTDTTTTERNEISSEVAKELQKDKSFDISGSVTVSKDTKIFGSINANVTSGYNSSSSSSSSNTEAKNYAKEITERALERIVQKTTERRTFKMIKEFEENNKHGFDNREGVQHVTGVYRWVDKIYENQMVNYGRRLLFEVSVPSPAEFYKKAMLWKSKTEETASNTLVPPKQLSEFGINSYLDIKSDNFSQAASAYGVTIEDYEAQTQYVNVDIPFTQVQDKTYSQSLAQPNIIIPTGFVAERIDGVGTFNYNTSLITGGGSAYIEFDFSGYKSYQGNYTNTSTKNFDYHFALSPYMSGSISLVIRYRNGKSFSGSFKVKCISDPALFTEWQESTFAALQAGYQAALDKYNEELKLQQAAEQAQADQEDNRDYSNPAMNRLIEERELKRLCIEMMSKPYCYEVGKTFYACKDYKCENTCGESENTVSEVIQNRELELYAEFIKFFETAFHWEILSYIFYPYYYNSKCKWSELLQTKNDDPIFEAFLQTGMAKVLVPVRPQYEKAVMWYLETGEIYTEDNLIPETEDDRYLSLLAELQNQDEIIVEGTWNTRIPSTLTIIQSKSTYLEDENGLPCCESEEKLFASDGRLLERLKSE